MIDEFVVSLVEEQIGGKDQRLRGFGVQQPFLSPHTCRLLDTTADLLPHSVHKKDNSSSAWYLDQQQQ